MLKKMRRRVIVSAMLAFSAVIFLIAFGVNAVNYAVVTNRADQTLRAIRTWEIGNPERFDPGEPGQGDPPPMKPFMGLPDMESNYMTRFFTVRFDADENAVYAFTDNIASVGEQDAIRYARAVLESGKQHGYYRSYRFAKEKRDDTTVVIFLNTTREQQSMRSLFLLSLIVCLLSLLIVFILVALFSRRAIRPIANNINRQKQFITDASHELKTPLTSISTSLDVITAEHGEDEWTDNIRHQTERMSKLVSELVTLSRLDEEIPLPDKEHFSLTQTAWEVFEVYKPQAAASGKKFDAMIEDGVMLFGDQAAVRKMFSVLLDNAIRYSDENGEIRFCVFRKRGKAQAEVFNTCHYEQIPDTDRLFDRFYRPDDSRSTKTGGNGVWLSIARAVAEAHGGTISAQCPSGNTMTIRIVF